MGGWIAAGKNGRKFSGCQLSPKPLGDKDETGKGGKFYLPPLDKLQSSKTEVRWLNRDGKVE